MSDIHQEWADLRKKNGEFICHLDGEMNKQHILEAQCQAQADRIKYLEDQIRAYKEQQKIDLAVKKDLDEKLDKATADCRALWVEKDRLKGQLSHEKAERDNLADTVTKMDKTIRDLNERNSNLRARLADKNSDLDELYQTINELTEQNKNLRDALVQAAKDAEVNFNNGRINGMKETWDELRGVYSARSMCENEDIFGYRTVGEILYNLSPTWFINRAKEYHEEEKKIHIGDEVEIFNTSCPDDNPHSDIGIVIAIDESNPCFNVIGSKFEGCFNETNIKSGRVKKTGKHFDSVPLDYLA